MQQESPYGQQAALVEEERCRGDLMYAILNQPDRILHQTKERLIDRMLDIAFDLVSKKNSPEFEKSRMVRESLAFLKLECADSNIKLFNFLFVLCKETEIQDMVRDGYDLDHPGNMWGRQAPDHFDDFIKALAPMIQTTLDWPCSEINIKSIVTNFVQTTIKKYVTT